jgi:NAD(P)-dependent dehydrogenase (short-subunit alcohol dehydrogenase family)
MLANKVVVVTGGCGLIGQALVKSIISANGIAIIADINYETGIEVRDHLSHELNTKNIDFIELDITSQDSITNLLSKLDGRYGRVDALINNAYPRNKNYGRHFFDVEYSDFCENLSLNLGGYFLTSQQFAQYFKAQLHGNIINISSIYGVIAPKFEIYRGCDMTVPVEYAAIKSALVHLTRYMAKYFNGMNIRVNSVSPGGVLDGQPDLFLDAYRNQSLNKGMLDREDICGTVQYLLSDLSKYVNGQNIVIDDGFSL